MLCRSAVFAFGLLVIGGTSTTFCAISAADEFAIGDWLRSATDFADVDRELSRMLLRGQNSVYDEPLVTDRPDFTEASSTVGRRVAQIETGYTFVYDDNEADGSITHAHNVPEILLRYGLTDHIELRLFWNYVWERTSDAGTATNVDGAEDFAIGTKIDLLTENGYRPEAAVIVEFAVPTGANAFSTDNLEVGVNFLYSWSLPRDWLLAGSTGFSTSAEIASLTIPPGNTIQANDRHNVWHQSITLGIPISEKVGWYFEYFGLYTDGLASDFPAHFIDGGFTYLWDNNTQFDIRAGHGLNDAAMDFFGGVGLSKRF